MYTYPVWRFQQSVYRCKLVDQRQIHVESVQGWPGWIRKIRAIRKRIHIVQILDPACQGHLARTLFLLYKVTHWLLHYIREFSWLRHCKKVLSVCEKCFHQADACRRKNLLTMVTEIQKCHLLPTIYKKNCYHYVY